MEILVIGDSCTDVYIYGDCPRLAPDGPVPVFIPKNRVEQGGMSYNVLNNLISLGTKCNIATNTTQITKTRYVDNKTNHLIVRVDTGEDSVNRIDLTKLNLSQYGGIIISDYDKGFLTEEDIKYICDNHPNVLIDTKRILGEYCRNAKFIKVNEYEYLNSKHILDKYLNLEDSLIVTLGGKGCTYQGQNFPVEEVEIKDQTGAGDTFVAGFMSKYLATNNVSTSIKFANYCASQVVQKRGTTVVNL